MYKIVLLFARLLGLCFFTVSFLLKSIVVFIVGIHSSSSSTREKERARERKEPSCMCGTFKDISIFIYKCLHIERIFYTDEVNLCSTAPTSNSPGWAQVRKMVGNVMTAVKIQFSYSNVCGMEFNGAG